MKTVSLRTFRDLVYLVPAVTEPVSVVVRRKGELVTLGTWTPAGVPFATIGAKPIAEAIRDAPPVHVAPLPAPRPFTPAPKPGKR